MEINLRNYDLCFCVTFTAICVLIALFLHPFAWGHTRVQRLCGAESSAYWPSDCKLGKTFFLFQLIFFFNFLKFFLIFSGCEILSNYFVTRHLFCEEKLIFKKLLNPKKILNLKKKCFNFRKSFKLLKKSLNLKTIEF